MGIHLKVGDGKLTTAVVFFSFILSLSTVVVHPFIDAVCHIPLISYTVMRVLQLGVFLLILVVALFPRPFPIREVWLAHDIAELKGRHIRAIVGLLGLVAVVEGIVQIISAVLGNAINTEKFKAEIAQATEAFSMSNTTLTLLFGGNGVFAHVVVAPFVEELIFRGVFLNFFLSRYKIGNAICATSVIFGVIHGNYLSAFFGGVLLGYVYVAYGRLWLCVLLHGFANLLTMAFFGGGGGLLILNFVEDGKSQVAAILIIAAIVLAALVKVRPLFNKTFTSAFGEVWSSQGIK